jgi:hypothetical protein
MSRDQVRPAAPLTSLPKGFVCEHSITERDAVRDQDTRVAGLAWLCRLRWLLRVPHLDPPGTCWRWPKSGRCMCMAAIAVAEVGTASSRPTVYRVAENSKTGGAVAFDDRPLQHVDDHVTDLLHHRFRACEQVGDHQPPICQPCRRSRTRPERASSMSARVSDGALDLCVPRPELPRPRKSFVWCR